MEDRGWRKARSRFPPSSIFHPPSSFSRLSSRRRLARGEERFNKAGGIERLNILGRFAKADELHGDVELLLDRQDHPTLSRAVELCEEDAADVDRGAEVLRLRDGILPA